MAAREYSALKRKLLTIIEHMKRYIKETEYAAASLIELIWTDFDNLEKLDYKLIKLNAALAVTYQKFLDYEFHPAANYYHAQMSINHEGVAKPRAELLNKVSEVSESLKAKSASISALSGALLQIAKQCISLKYGKPKNAPDGDDIEGVLIKDIIFEGRNQSIHYENPKEISVNVVNLFAKLDTIRGDGNAWDPCSQNNFAFEVVKFLGWRTYSDFEVHLKSIRSKKGS